MRVEHLSYLLDVAHYQSISAAASNLFISQTTLSSIINSLESELKTKIFERTRKGVVLTPEGEQIIALSEEVLSHYAQLLEATSAAAPKVRQINLIAYPGACSVVGLYLAKKIQDVYEKYALNTYETTSTKVVDRVIEGVSNVAIGSSAKDEFFRCQHKAHNAGLTFEHIYTDEFYLCVNEASPFASRESVDLPELLDGHLAITPHYKGSSASSVGGFHKMFRCHSVFPNNEIAKKAVLLNGMISILPGIALYDDYFLGSGQLRKIRLTGFKTELFNYLVCNEKNGLSSAEQYLTEEIKRFYESLG